MNTFRRLLLSLGALCTAALLSTPAHAADEPVTIFAAASLKNALDDVNAAWVQRGGKAATISYAASGTLAKQIERGAPADLFMSADREWMQYLSGKSLTKKGSERELLGNRLVLIAPKAASVRLKIAPGFDLVAALGGGRLAMCNATVPAGRYGGQALRALGIWPQVETHTAPADNVRAALALVARGEAPLGIVYATDAHAEPAVQVVDTFPSDSHEPIVYPIAQLADSKNPAAAALLDFIESDAARPLFERQGFTVLGR